MSYLVVFTQEKNGYFSASVPALPGCFSQGENLQDAKKNVQEAIELYLEDEEIDETTQFDMQIIGSVDVSVKKSHA